MLFARSLLLFLLFNINCFWFTATRTAHGLSVSQAGGRRGLHSNNSQKNVISEEESSSSSMRRKMMIAAGSATPFIFSAQPALANKKSRADGYKVQKPDDEWKSILSPKQYYILREGGTEQPNSSILYTEKRIGIFSCAGCGSSLFDSNQKFNSGTGWPSFATGVPGEVEIEEINAVQKTLLGAELRCNTCGGHLGDVFSDGYLFVGTPAALSGKRFCIDGAALVFRSSSDKDVVVRGDDTPQKAKTMTPKWLEPPTIKASS